MTDDIVTTLRRESFYRPTSRLNSFGMPQMGFELTSFNLIAADEIERLRNELAARCRTPSVATTRTEGDPNSQLEELRSEVAAWRSAFRGEDEFDGRVE